MRRTGRGTDPLFNFEAIPSEPCVFQCDDLENPLVFRGIHLSKFQKVLTIRKHFELLYEGGGRLLDLMVTLIDLMPRIPNCTSPISVVESLSVSYSIHITDGYGLGTLARAGGALDETNRPSHLMSSSNISGSYNDHNLRNFDLQFRTPSATNTNTMYRSLLLLSSLFPCLLQAQSTASSTEIPPSDYVLDYTIDFPEDQDSGGSLTLTTPGDWNTATARIESGDSTSAGMVLLNVGAPGEVLWIYVHEPNHFGPGGFSITVDDINGEPHHVYIGFTQQAANDPMTITFGGECTAMAMATMENQTYTLTPCILEEDGPALAFQLTASDDRMEWARHPSASARCRPTEP